MLAKPARNSNRQLIDMESAGATQRRKFELIEFTRSDVDSLARS
jgi:hypothetical protein